MKIILVDERITEKCERALQKEGFRVIRLPADPDLGDSVKSHPDTLIFRLSGELITTADYCDRAAYIFSDLREICDVKISFTSDKRGINYPQDAKMNGLVIGKALFINTKSAASAILDRACELGYTVCHTHQGYPACTTLAFGSSAITADRGMAKVLADHDINVTLISEGHISLPPHEYGFIGGASVVSENKVYFFGNISAHPDYDSINRAITSEGYSIVALSDEPLTDFGGAIIL